MNAAILGDDIGRKIDSGILHKLNETLGLHSIAHFLPYQFYDHESGLYHMHNAKGFILNVTPMVGASSDNAEALYNLLQRTLPEGVIVHFLMEASPYVGDALQGFVDSRQNGSEVLQKNAAARAEFLQKGCYQSLIPGQNALIRDFQLSISLVFDNDMEISVHDIQSHRQRVMGVLQGMGMSAKIVEAEDFLSLIDSLLRPTGLSTRTHFSYNEQKTLSEQLAAPNHTHKVTSQRILVDEDWEIRSYRVADFPKAAVHLFEMDDLIGSLFDNNTRVGCPFVLSFMLHIGDQSRFKDIGYYRGYRARQRAKELGQDSPKAGDEAYDALNILRQLEDNEKVVLGDFQVFLYCRQGEGDTHETAMMNVFQAPAKKWRLVKNNLLHLVSLVSHLPLAQSKALFKDLEKLGLPHKLWSMNAANMAPILAEMKGMPSHRLLFMGRRGQILFWDPFLNNRGNYNTCVAGISGSGKSVTVQEIAASLIGTGARVWIIDVGRSYKKLCHLLEGQFIEFTKEANLCLNPFTTVNPQELDEFFAFMVPLVALMADPNNASTALELSLIEQAVKGVWEEKGSQGGIGDISRWLQAHEDKRAHDIGTTLYAYTEDGQFGGYFNGTSNVNFDNAMVVFELEEINSNKRLQSIIFMLLMYHVTEKMYLGGRTTQMALIIDEAWDMLKGGYGGDIIESIARRARKYKGCLITITQSLSDFFASPAGMAAYNNSYWRILHQQNKENINNLINDKQLTLDPFQERLLRSISTEHGQYSELMIQGGAGEYAVVRLILEPFSQILYSTQGDDYAAVGRLCREGVDISEAVEVVSKIRSNEIG